MKIAYLTIDEVNEDLAQRIAAECDVTLDPRWPKEWPPKPPYDAWLIDLDSLPADWRQRIVAELLSSGPACPVAVHSHNLDGHADALCANGIGVYRHLAQDLFIALCLAGGQRTPANRLMGARKLTPQPEAEPTPIVA